MSLRRTYLVAYDVSDDRRLRTVYRKMNGFGDPVQLSVFRCVLSPTECELMVDALLEIIDEKADRVLIADLGPARRRGKRSIRVLGRRQNPPEEGPVVF